jgi:hypothetical protein
MGIPAAAAAHESIGTATISARSTMPFILMVSPGAVAAATLWDHTAVALRISARGYVHAAEPKSIITCGNSNFCDVAVSHLSGLDLARTLSQRGGWLGWRMYIGESRTALAECARIRAYDFFCIIDTLTSASVLPGIDVIIDGYPNRVAFVGHDHIDDMSSYGRYGCIVCHVLPASAGILRLPLRLKITLPIEFGQKSPSCRFVGAMAPGHATA